jgi:hypothetical protein
MDILLENVRTFAGKHRFPIGRLTILTGENSAGKSTLLGMMAGLSNQDEFPLDPPFDTAPYELGSYDTIATYKGGRYGRAKTFGVGFETEASGEAPARRIYAQYESDNGRVALLNFEVTIGDQAIHLEVKERTAQSQSASVRFTAGAVDESVTIKIPRNLGEKGSRFNFQNTLMSALLFRGDEEARRRDMSVYRKLLDVLFLVDPGPVVSVAPIRTRPERTYSQSKQAFDPTGDHIPFVLDRLLSKGSSRAERRQVTAALEQFGRESGLFEAVSVKKLGSKATDPFQVMVQLAGRLRNMIDVGYGVSQALPVVVQTVLENPKTTVLMQQPEVHLHPRAQAALGSFFCQMVKAADRRLVIESHSDFIVDRVRQEVAAGTIPPDWVRIIFFHREGYETTVYPLRLDAEGNILDCPAFYREFFLREELRLLSRAG